MVEVEVIPLNNEWTRKEFMEAPLPVYWVRIEGSAFSTSEVDLISKWLGSNTEAHFYRDGDYFHFEKSEDRTYFSLWIKSDPFGQNHGTVMERA